MDTKGFAMAKMMLVVVNVVIAAIMVFSPEETYAFLIGIDIFISGAIYFSIRSRCGKLSKLDHEKINKHHE